LRTVRLATTLLTKHAWLLYLSVIITSVIFALGLPRMLL